MNELLYILGLMFGEIESPDKKGASQCEPATACLAIVVYTEARGEPLDGMVAVANVVKNRAIRKEKSICEVIQEPNQFEGVALFQERQSKPWLTDKVNWRTSMLVAHMVLEYDFKVQDCEGVEYFYQHHIDTNWSRNLTPVCEIGGHTFSKSLANR